MNVRAPRERVSPKKRDTEFHWFIIQATQGTPNGAVCKLFFCFFLNGILHSKTKSQELDPSPLGTEERKGCAQSFPQCDHTTRMPLGKGEITKSNKHRAALTNHAETERGPLRRPRELPTFELLMFAPCAALLWEESGFLRLQEETSRPTGKGTCGRDQPFTLDPSAEEMLFVKVIGRAKGIPCQPPRLTYLQTGDPERAVSLSPHFPEFLGWSGGPAGY